MFVEANESDSVQSVVDLISGLVKIKPEDIALVYLGKRLDNTKVPRIACSLYAPIITSVYGSATSRMPANRSSSQ